MDIRNTVLDVKTDFLSQLWPIAMLSVLVNISLWRLISTDAAARGIDVSGVKCVVNYDAPQYVRTYIHRSAAVIMTAFPVSSTSLNIFLCLQGWKNCKSRKIRTGIYLSVRSSGETHLLNDWSHIGKKLALLNCVLIFRRKSSSRWWWMLEVLAFRSR